MVFLQPQQNVHFVNIVPENIASLLLIHRRYFVNLFHTFVLIDQITIDCEIAMLYITFYVGYFQRHRHFVLFVLQIGVFYHLLLNSFAHFVKVDIYSIDQLFAIRTVFDIDT